MAAELDKSNNFVFGMDKPELDAGAIAIGNSVYAGNSIKYLSKIHTEHVSAKQTWSVCPHLSEPKFVYDYYLSSGMVIIVSGHCFCESCLDMILSQNDLSELVDSGRKMTDWQFQRKFIEPLFSSNTKFTSSYKYQENNADSQKTWITCSHLASGDGLRKIYRNGGQLCIFESYFTCQDCFNMIPTESLVDILYKGEAMTNSNIQERVIDYLYQINLDSLSALGRFDKDLLASSF